MIYKNIVVIDDLGDVFEPLNDAFSDDLEIKIRHLTSDFDSLKKYLTRDTYIILINETGLKVDLDQLVDFIQRNLFFLAIPILIVSDNEEVIKRPPKLDSPVLNVALKPLVMSDFKPRLEYAIEVFEYNRNINDISGLPGNKIISSKLLSEISKNSKFALVFLDLDNFKEFDEYYGLYKGSQVMYFLANLIEESIKEYGSIEDFVGNVGGDDFIMILKDYKAADLICKDIIAKFDKQILDFYDEDDIKNGYIETMNRDGEIEKISFMGISVVIMNYMEFKGKMFDEVFRKMNEVKKIAKQVDGSVLLDAKNY
ncbi:hypothetical protein TL18_04300 [Methanobrevibacter sp. YE315]|uniref:diguanylate cyclase domain-containing protein n=1 Tax=Methanobrevibacter sp. YE315 TaxID=1609968 RepID=UPI000764E0EE|nr:diguanylate cyclase [Methanobrevibacter sp. YE315]AMD17311.1 hypothetical protein TL18_04300 [Methanobrevibacter sp. YE315]